MVCRSCGTEIADKALVCFRCGEATTEAKFKAPAPRQSRWSLHSLLGNLSLVVLVVLALFMAARAGTESPTVRWIVVGVAVAIVILRSFARRARR